MLNEKLMEALEGVQSNVHLEPEKKLAYSLTAQSGDKRRGRCYDCDGIGL